jgi:hypothetical protein
MKTAPLPLLLLVILPQGFAYDQPAMREVQVGRYRVVLPSTWQRFKSESPKVAMVVERNNGAKAKLVADVLASPLPGNIEKESSELIESAKKKPMVFSIQEVGDFVTKSGVKGKRILVSINAQDPNYGSPQAFYSIYLPQGDGTCLTIKLRCGAADFAGLRRDFEDMMAGAKETQSP